jgi:hypothetical protein
MECYDQDVRREKDVMAYEGASASVGAPRTIQLAHGTPPRLPTPICPSGLRFINHGLPRSYDALKVIGGGVHFC